MLSALLSALLLAGPPVGAPLERPVPVAASGGVTLAGTLTVPPGPGPHPAVAFVGGFGPTNADGAFGGGGRGVYDAIALGLARRGVAVLRYDKRGIGGSGGPALSWLDARLLARDAVAVVRTLAALPGVDRARIALVGHSQGGALALRVAPSTPATRLVALAAPGRPLGELPRAIPGARDLLDRLLGAEAAGATLSLDPRRAAARAAQPALLVHGTRDRTVPAGDMLRLAGARQRADRETDTLLVPGAGHFLQVDGRVPAPVLDAVAAFIS